MNKYENEKINMYQAVEAVCRKHKQTINSMQPATDAVEEFSNSIAEIVRRDNDCRATMTSLVAAKKNARERVAELAFTIENGLCLVGRKTNNEQLKSSCRIPMSELNTMKITDLLQTGNRFLDFVEVYKTNLAAYGISGEDIVEFRLSIAELKRQANNQQIRFIESRTVREVLFDDAFDRAEEILKENLDKISELLKSKDTIFYNQYWTARITKNIGTAYTEKPPVTDPITFPEETVTIPWEKVLESSYTS